MSFNQRIWNEQEVISGAEKRVWVCQHSSIHSTNTYCLPEAAPLGGLYALERMSNQPLFSCCCCSVLQSCPTLCDPVNRSTPGFPVLHHLPEFAQTHVHWVSDATNHLILCHLLLLLPSVFPSMRVFSNESVLRIRWWKYWSFSFSIGPSNEYSGLISFRIDRFDLLAGQWTRKSLLQHHNSKAPILQLSAFFMVWLSHLYMTIVKTIAFLDGRLSAK